MRTQLRLASCITVISIGALGCGDAQDPANAEDWRALEDRVEQPDEPESRPEAVPDVSAASAAQADLPLVLVEDPGAPSAEPVNQAIAVLAPTAGSSVRGTVRFVQDSPEDPGLRVQAEVSGLPPGPHAYHVHLLGNCSAADATSAGTHFNFEGPSRDPGQVERITGDLGELEAGESGEARHEHRVEDASLHGLHSIVGRSVIVHARGNDPESPPLGDAGGRLACGTIGIAEAQAAPTQ